MLATSSGRSKAHSGAKPMDLSEILQAGSIIAGTDSSSEKVTNANTLDEILRRRLTRYDAVVRHDLQVVDLDLAELELLTAKESLWVVERVQSIVAGGGRGEGAGTSSDSHIPTSKTNPTSTPPLLGAWDLGQIRIHLSIAFKWGTELLLSRILPTLPNKRSPKLPPGAHYVDLTSSCEDYLSLSHMVLRLSNLVADGGADGFKQLSQTIIIATLMNRHVTDLLRPMICLGWLPDELRGDLPPFGEKVRAFTMRFLSCLQPSQTIAHLGQVLATPIHLPVYMHKICGQLLCSQLLRPHGVPGLFSALFGEDASTTEAPLEKLERVSKVLGVPPQGVPRPEYFATIMPPTIHLLTPTMSHITPPAHTRAAAFSLSRMVAAPSQTSRDIQNLIISWILHDPFIPSAVRANLITHQDLSEVELKALAVSTKALVLNASAALWTLSTVIGNTDPSPSVMSAFLGPIIPQLFTLTDYLMKTKTADPELKALVENLLAVWASASTKDGVVDALMRVIDGEGYDWEVDEANELHVIMRPKKPPSLSLAELADLQDGKLNLDENPLEQRPDPARFAAFLKSMNRREVTNQVFLCILELLRSLWEQVDVDPVREMLIMQLFFHLNPLASSGSSSDGSAFSETSHLLIFIKYGLARERTAKTVHRKSLGISLDSLRIASDDEDDSIHTGGDSDDEDDAPGLEGVERNDHLAVTSINLLLALLERNPALSPRSHPELNEIYSFLEPLAQNSSDKVRPLAQEARLVITARVASQAATKASPDTAVNVTHSDTETTQETYQRALKLLQDPLLPVRAHGLLLLRDLVAPKKEPPPKKKTKRKGKRTSRPGSSSSNGSGVIQGGSINAPAIDAAFVPAILNIFLESIQDEDSYIFLNAVQGLAAMVDGFGKEVLKGIIDVYTKGLTGIGSSVLTPKDVDVRVRVGEALRQIIERCGGALGIYVDIIVPPLFSVVRASHLPTTVRTSAISLLGQCADTNAIAIGSYVTDLAEAMIDLIQIESVQLQSLPGTQPAIAEQQSCTQSHSTDFNSKADVGSSSSGIGKGKSKTNGGVTRGKARRSQPFNNHEQTGDKITEDSGAGAKSEAEKTMDSNPTVANPKFPPLRRAALHFFTILVRTTTTRIYDIGDADAFPLPGSVMKRAATVLNYIAATDRDEVVRVMAREGSEEVEELKNAIYGI